MQASYFLGCFPKPWKKEDQIYLKKPDKESYHLENSYCSISLSNVLGKIYERVIFQQATNILEENNFFKRKNLHVYKKDASQALLLLIEQMCEGVASGKYGIAVFADLQGAFDALWRKGQYISCTKQVSLTIFQSFPAFSLTNSIYRNLVNSYTSDWARGTLTP